MPRRLLFRPKHRLTHKRQFDAVHEARMKTPVGPLMVYSRRNGLEHPRLGLSIGRSFGSAPKRNRLKRCLREAFRLLQFELPSDPALGAYDLVLSTRRHDEAGLEQYLQWMREAAHRLDRDWRRREGQS
ncbi:MAG: ribonuclease P protein component [Phycisphaerales bacterium]|nr:ribonuclease P protein component [Planctomycetota bacterium]